MLIAQESLDELMEIFRHLGVNWEGPIDNPLQPRYKGFFRGKLIAIYCDFPMVVEIKCLDREYAREFDELVASFFEAPTPPERGDAGPGENS